MSDRTPNGIASGRVEDLLDAIGKPKAEHAAQGQQAQNFDMSVRDEMQGQQERRPMPGQDRFIRADESLRPSPAAEKPELPPQAPAGNPDELIPSIVPSAAPGSRTP